ncbi:nucleotidyltransferase domain-containing protein [Flindersiella endophytica]
MKAETSLVRDYLEAAYPELRAALLTGSIVRGTATATSDLDVVVLLPSGFGSVRETVGWSGRTVDVFGYDLAALERWLAVDTSQRRPGLSSMVLDGVLIAGSPSVAAEARAAAQRVYEAGPAPWTEAQLLRLRYGVTDVLLDLETAGDRAESLLLASTLVTEAVTLLFATAGHWSGNGKWLLRELRGYDAELAADLEAAYDELARAARPEPLVRVADRILSRCGGRYLIGRSERS